MARQTFQRVIAPTNLLNVPLSPAAAGNECSTQQRESRTTQPLRGILLRLELVICHGPSVATATLFGAHYGITVRRRRLRPATFDSPSFIIAALGGKKEHTVSIHYGGRAGGPQTTTSRLSRSTKARFKKLPSLSQLRTTGAAAFGKPAFGSASDDQRWRRGWVTQPLAHEIVTSSAAEFGQGV